jgi:hypothetical protein
MVLAPDEDNATGQYTMLFAFGVVLGYFIFICVCVTVGPRRIIKCLLVSDATVPEDVPILNWFGWGLGVGPCLTKVLVGLCNLPVQTDEETA